MARQQQGDAWGQARPARCHAAGVPPNSGTGDALGAQVDDLDGKLLYQVLDVPPGASPEQIRQVSPLGSLLPAVGQLEPTPGQRAGVQGASQAGPPGQAWRVCSALLQGPGGIRDAIRLPAAGRVRHLGARTALPLSR